MKAFSEYEALRKLKQRFFGREKRRKLMPDELKRDFARSGVPGTVLEENCGMWAQILKPKG